MPSGYFGMYRGSVVNNADPEKRGRLMLQVPTVTGLRQTIWAEASRPSGFPVIAPKPGDPIWVEYEGGDTGRPIWVGIPGSISGGGGGGDTVSFDSLLVGDLTVSGAATFAVSPTVPDSSWSIAKTTGLQAALDSKYSPTNPQPVVAPSAATAMMLMGA